MKWTRRTYRHRERTIADHCTTKKRRKYVSNEEKMCKYTEIFSHTFNPVAENKSLVTFPMNQSKNKFRREIFHLQFIVSVSRRTKYHHRWVVFVFFLLLILLPFYSTPPRYCAHNSHTIDECDPLDSTTFLFFFS